MRKVVLAKDSSTYVVEYSKVEKAVNVSDICKRQVLRYLKTWPYKDAADINTEACMMFAKDLYNKVGGECCACRTKDKRISCHAFVHHKGKFYDSETPEGIVNYKKLPCFIRLGCDPKLSYFSERDY